MTARELTTMTSSTEAQVIKIARGQFDWTGELTATTDLRRELDLDSLHLVELQVAVEDHFRVAFDPLDEQLVDAFRTVRTLAAYVDYLATKGR